ncbi:MAG: UDP-N-acetylmuramoyl-L-alanyl-D-glutamate--2,6-diaminopimelate ligase [Omnitrophica bacterium RIFCSPLOWO2_02_FULL_45_16]|nr:MAG: UDP-N-acetylmuramoyl-L-alanyl-D-glutamate--2,6-diaminopimelate ligase [Omnitrophica bacterium RIFCSPLOWO2_12_FULL_45_13]OGW94428.1 MAG: UDP-N-acetylmuramoyl-L-alanyl-D-glutamate--2,6-diaminopimelate ligase [Omnitrophica bacterium RIFCSPLOWO2_01_FULL_45_24]OGX00335.1 MAG: UDP-N-acetylmuramoyl-L-alanyl-D-glutamate--2,6-diaminopimelate ligase [Omnitrophica bacterium RIFCSPLOWO2_02_FULL_45_16]
MVRIKDIFKGIKYKTDEDLSNLAIKKIAIDSRKVGKGSLFIAMRGYNTDGYKFIDEAIKKGAKVVVAEKDFNTPSGVKKILIADTRKTIPIVADNFYRHPSKKLKIVGVTGTNGKTTITYLIENILKWARKDSGVIGTINYRIKGKGEPAANTTPGALELQSLLSKMLKNRARYVIMEVSSHSLDQGRVDQVLFDVGIFTNITKEHLDYHKTIKNYFNAKARLFDKLKNSGIAILNSDDKIVRALKKRIKNRVLTYGIENKSDIMASSIFLSMDSSAFSIKTPKCSFKVKTALIGRHNISNILASVAAAIALGVSVEAIKKGIESFTSVPGRLEIVDLGQPFKVFVDYAHTEDALYNILSLLREVTKNGRIITVFGCGGNRDRSKRPLMGNVACRFSDKVVVTSDNPRFEDSAGIISEIETGIKRKFSNYCLVEDRRTAIDNALKSASKGDVVVIAGKGHEKYQIMKDRVMPFDDREVVRSILKGNPRILKKESKKKAR